MARFIVLDPPDGNAEKAVFIRDRFTFWAFVLPVVWFLGHRMWLEALAAFAATACLGALGTLAAFEWGATVASLAVSAVIALEAPALHAWALRRRGWHEVAALEAEDFTEAEMRYFGGRAEQTPAAPLSERQTPPWSLRPTGPALGLLDMRGAP